MHIFGTSQYICRLGRQEVDVNEFQISKTVFTFSKFLQQTFQCPVRQMLSNCCRRASARGYLLDEFCIRVAQMPSDLLVDAYLVIALMHYEYLGCSLGSTGHSLLQPGSFNLMHSVWYSPTSPAISAVFPQRGILIKFCIIKYMKSSEIKLHTSKSKISEKVSINCNGKMVSIF